MPDPASRPDESPAGTTSDAAYLVSAVACAVLVAIPFLLVEIPPITDLPQQTAQIRLLLETLTVDDVPPVAGPRDTEYRVQWWHPNKLGYAPLLLTWLVASPIAAGRLGVLVIGWLWVAALHALARAIGRPPPAAALATVFFFNHLTYWGLLNFLVGLPVFVLWFVLLERSAGEEPAWRDGWKLLAAAMLLYSAHVLWLAAGLAWLLVSGLLRRLPLAALARRIAWVAPPILLALVWYPSLERSGFVSETVWGRTPGGRLHPEWFLNSALGGLHGSVEPILAGVVLGWLLLGLWSRRGAGPEDDAGHRLLALAAGLFVLASLCLPAVIQSTIFFASRWLPIGVVLLVLACPQPRLRPLLRTAVPYVVLASLAAATASVWVEFEHRELDGLHQALDAAPPGVRVLGLDLVRTSFRIKGYPYYHLYAWTQTLKGNEVARSFANFGSSLVVFRDMPRTFPWTDGLDWRARKVRKSDMDHFGAVIIFGRREAHELFLADGRLAPLTDARPWRLYRVLE